MLGSSKWETSKTSPQSFQSAHRRQSWTIRNPTGCRSWKPMAPWYHTTCRLWRYYNPIVPYYHSLHWPHQAPTTTKPQTPPAKTHQRPRTATHQEPQKKRIDPKALKAHKATGKVKNRKDKNPLYYICWVRIAQWLEWWSCKPMVMGSIPGCGGTPSIPQSDNPQSATRIKDYFRRSQPLAHHPPNKFVQNLGGSLVKFWW